MGRNINGRGGQGIVGPEGGEVSGEDTGKLKAWGEHGYLAECVQYNWRPRRFAAGIRDRKPPVHQGLPLLHKCLMFLEVF